jgi:hypothetical protein
MFPPPWQPDFPTGPAQGCKAFWFSCSFLLSFAPVFVAAPALSTCAKAHLSIHSRLPKLLRIIDWRYIWRRFARSAPWFGFSALAGGLFDGVEETGVAQETFKSSLAPFPPRSTHLIPISPSVASSLALLCRNERHLERSRRHPLSKTDPRLQRQRHKSKLRELL